MSGPNSSFKADDLFVRFGKQSDRLTASGSMKTLIVAQDGFQLSGNRNQQSLDTDHGSAGTAIRFESARNSEAQGIGLFGFPDTVGSLFELAFADPSDIFANWRFYKGGVVAAGDFNGQDFRGCIPNGITLTIDRSGEGQVIQIDTQWIPNAVRNLEQGVDAVPVKTLTQLIPYRTNDVFLDIDYGSGSVFGGDSPEILRVTLNYQRNAEVSQYRGNTDAALNNVWTQVEGADVALTAEVVVNVDGYDWPFEKTQLAELEEAGLRIALTHPRADKTTTGDPLLAGDNGTQTLTAADATEFEAGDVVFIQQADENAWTVLPIDGITVNDLDFDTAAVQSDVAISGAGTNIQNMAAYIGIPRLSLEDFTHPARDGRKRAVTLSFAAQLNVGESSLLTHLAYDHPDSRL